MHSGPDTPSAFFARPVYTFGAPHVSTLHFAAPPPCLAGVVVANISALGQRQAIDLRFRRVSQRRFVKTKEFTHTGAEIFHVFSRKRIAERQHPLRVRNLRKPVGHRRANAIRGAVGALGPHGARLGVDRSEPHV